MLKLIALLVTGIPAIIAATLAFFARKATTAVGSIALFIVMTGAFIACINVILQSVLAILTIPTWISNGVGMFIPVDFSACLASVVSGRICRAAYDMAQFKIKLINNAS